jgi:hypothetical protein
MIQAEGVQSFLAGSRLLAPLYMATGVKVARGGRSRTVWLDFVLRTTAEKLAFLVLSILLCGEDGDEYSAVSSALPERNVMFFCSQKWVR